MKRLFATRGGPCNFEVLSKAERYMRKLYGVMQANTAVARMAQ